MKRHLLLLAMSLMAVKFYSQAYFLNGSATSIGNDCYQLTYAANNLNGTVWYADQIDLNQPFDLQFSMNFGFLDEGADGICFVLQNVGNTAIGLSGGGMGYQSFDTSLGIEFDTYQNGDSADPFEDHIAIEINGDVNHSTASTLAGPIQASTSDINIEDGADHLVRVKWDPTTHIVEVYFDCDFRLSTEIDLIQDIFSGENLVYWGFTAATGGAVNFQTVCLQDNILTLLEEDLTLCTGGSILLEAGDSFDGVYTWTPTTDLTFTNTQSTTANPTQSITYSVSYQDICNQPVVQTFNIDVSPLTVEVSNIEFINCINSSSNVQSVINFDVNATYVWTLDGNVVFSSSTQTGYAATEIGNYELNVLAMNGCEATTTFSIEGDFSTYEVFAGEDQFINCYQASVPLTATSENTNAVVFWEQNGNNIPGANALNYLAESTGVYTVNVVHPTSGCVSSDDVTISNNFSSPEISIGLQDSLTCTFPQVVIENVVINSPNEVGIVWSTVDGLITSGITQLNATVAAEAIYQISAQDLLSGCITTDQVFISEADNFNVDISSLTFPNIITTNGDSKNEALKPYLLLDREANLSSVFSTYELKVFDRWGKMIFESKSINNAWRPSEASDGVYYYTFKYQTSCDQGKKGVMEGYVHLVK